MACQGLPGISGLVGVLFSFLERYDGKGGGGCDVVLVMLRSYYWEHDKQRNCHKKLLFHNGL